MRTCIVLHKAAVIPMEVNLEGGRQCLCNYFHRLKGSFYAADLTHRRTIADKFNVCLRYPSLPARNGNHLGFSVKDSRLTDVHVRAYRSYIRIRARVVSITFCCLVGCFWMQCRYFRSGATRLWKQQKFPSFV